jgi:tRNA pseudouridine32 synthase/23S rRNA pseudouridine746 synthase
VHVVVRSVPDADPYHPPPDDGLEPVHLDAGFVVLVKPPGLLSEPGRGEAKRDSLLVRAQARFAGARIVHRLDMMTSGLLVLALDAPTHATLSAAFRERRVDKRYEALVHGPWLDGEAKARLAGEIDLPLIVDWPNRPRQVVCHDTGKPSLTRYRVVAGDEAHTGRDGIAHRLARVALEPVTGRTHQLRVHLAALGHPIAGDPFYGRAGDSAPRMMLHAVGLAFDHPATGEPLAFGSPAPF